VDVIGPPIRVVPAGIPRPAPQEDRAVQSIPVASTNAGLPGVTDSGSGASFVAGGLWGLEFGNGGTGSNGPSNTLFFSAGPTDSGGIFGSITPVPEPASLALAGFGGVVAFSLRRRRG
jgi:hypothetical protein